MKSFRLAWLALSSFLFSGCALTPPSQEAIEDSSLGFVNFGLSAISFSVPTVFSAASSKPADESTPVRISHDYMASDNVGDARAYVYGERTLLEFARSPAILIIRDAAGEPVEFERVGRYYRLSRRLDRFTVVVNGRSVYFSSASLTQ